MAMEDSILKNLQTFIGFARKRVGDAHLAEDVVQESLVKALAAHPAVRVCCVVGAPDPDLGEVPVAYVVINNGQTVGEKDLKGEVESRLPRSWVPARVTVLDALPENRVGKIDRQALKKIAAGA